MNKDRRKRIEEVTGKLRDIEAELEDIKSEEEEYYDNMPESIQGGEKGERAQAAIDELDNALSSIGEACDSLENIE